MSVITAVNVARKVRDFFDEVRWVDLQLPDGWLGDRPMENLYQLTYLASRPRRLLIELDDQILVSFAGGALAVERSLSYETLPSGTPALVFSNFRQCVVEILGFGDLAPSLLSYLEGSVRLIAPFAGGLEPIPIGG